MAEAASSIAKCSKIHTRISSIQNLLLKKFVTFCKYLVSKVLCLVLISAFSNLGLVWTFCSIFRSRDINFLSQSRKF